MDSHALGGGRHADAGGQMYDVSTCDGRDLQNAKVELVATRPKEETSERTKAEDFPRRNTSPSIVTAPPAAPRNRICADRNGSCVSASLIN